MTEETLIAPPQARDHKEDLFTAKPWQLIWRRFSRHTLAVISMWFLAF
jgi:peptide/nickel transport system permease protein